MTELWLTITWIPCKKVINIRWPMLDHFYSKNSLEYKIVTYKSRFSTRNWYNGSYKASLAYSLEQLHALSLSAKLCKDPEVWNVSWLFAIYAVYFFLACKRVENLK